MSHRYSQEQKSAALSQLRANHGNIALTHLQTGIPERTLFAWRRETYLQQQQHTPLPQREALVQPPDEALSDSAPLPDIPDFDDDLEAVKYVRSHIVKELVSLSTSINQGLFVTTPYQRVFVLSQLLDRLMKLDAHIKPYIPAEQIIRIEYASPEEMEDTVP